MRSRKPIHSAIQWCHLFEPDSVRFKVIKKQVNGISGIHRSGKNNDFLVTKMYHRGYAWQAHHLKVLDFSPISGLNDNYTNSFTMKKLAILFTGARNLMRLKMGIFLFFHAAISRAERTYQVMYIHGKDTVGGWNSGRSMLRHHLLYM